MEELSWEREGEVGSIRAARTRGEQKMKSGLSSALLTRQWRGALYSVLALLGMTAGGAGRVAATREPAARQPRSECEFVSSRILKRDVPYCMGPVGFEPTTNGL